MQENPESQEKKEVKEVIFEAPGVPKPGSTEEARTRPEGKTEGKEASGEVKTEDTSLERKEPKESDFKAPEELETGYTQESWAKPEKSMEEIEAGGDLAQERKEPEGSEFKAPGELETGYTQESWAKPEKVMEEKEASREFKTEVREETGEKTREEAGEEKSTTYTMERRLAKSKTDRKIFGVCGGLGEYFGIDSTLIRLAFVVLTLFNGIGLVIYIILAIIMPSEKSVEMVPSTRKSS